jgi:predicted DNA-binding transcriptional regulator AlpA
MPTRVTKPKQNPKPPPSTIQQRRLKKRRLRKKLLPPSPSHDKRERDIRAEDAPVDASPGGSPIRFLTKKEVCARVRLTFPTIWKKMREGTFPRARATNTDYASPIVWLEHEIEAWMLGLPARQYLGEMVRVGANVRIVGSPHHSTIKKEAHKGQ